MIQTNLECTTIMNETGKPDTSQSSKTTDAREFDSSKLPPSRTGGTHCTHIHSTYGVLGKDNTFASEEKSKGFGVNWAHKIKGKISRF